MRTISLVTVASHRHPSTELLILSRPNGAWQIIAAERSIRYLKGENPGWIGNIRFRGRSLPCQCFACRIQCELQRFARDAIDEGANHPGKASWNVARQRNRLAFHQN